MTILGSAAPARLEGCHAFVTGGGRGIGRAIAQGLICEGAHVTVTSRTRAELDEVVQFALARGGVAKGIVVDALDGQAIKRSVREAGDHFGRLDILVNNVGGVSVDDMAKLAPLTHDDQAFESNLFLNLTATYYATVAALPYMVKGNFGRVINIGSGYAKRAGGPMVYVTAKHGIVGLTKALAVQVPTSITVNCVCPGWINTGLLNWSRIGAATGTDPADAKRAAEAECVQNRILEADELVPMLVLLATDESNGITGQVISIDGGYKL